MYTGLGRINAAKAAVLNYVKRQIVYRMFLCPSLAPSLFFFFFFFSLVPSRWILNYSFKRMTVSGLGPGWLEVESVFTAAQA